MLPTSITSRAILLAALFSGWTPIAGAAEELKIGGTGNALGTMQRLADAFNQQNPDVKATVLPSMGSSGAVKAVPKGAIDIGLSSRDLTDAERQSGAVSVEYARTPLVFAVATTTKTTAITLDQVADLYSGQLLNWPEGGGQIRPVLRQPGDDNTRQVRDMSPALDQAMTLAEKRPGMPFAVTDQDAADKIGSIPGAIGVTTLALMLSENRPLRALTLDGVEPTAENAAAGRYPYYKRLFLITRANPPAKVQQFKAFLIAPTGRDILTGAGHWIP